MKDIDGNEIEVGDIVEYVEQGEDEYGTRMRVREIKPGRCRCDDAWMIFTNLRGWSG